MTSIDRKNEKTNPLPAERKQQVIVRRAGLVKRFWKRWLKFVINCETIRWSSTVQRSPPDPLINSYKLSVAKGEGGEAGLSSFLCEFFSNSPAPFAWIVSGFTDVWLCKTLSHFWQSYSRGLWKELPLAAGLLGCSRGRGLPGTRSEEGPTAGLVTPGPGNVS